MILLMYQPSPQHFRKLGEIAGDREIRIATDEEKAKSYIEDAEVVMGNRYFIQSLPYARKLRWMQSNSVGVDIILQKKELLIEKGILLTCARGVYDQELTEHTLALVLALSRSVHIFRDHQHKHLWERHRLITLEGKKCMILGWGSLARRVAITLSGLGMVVSGARNQETDSTDGHFAIYSRSSWKNRLSNTDFLVICLPKTPETINCVGAGELSLLPSGAFIINIGRGGTLDEAALLEQIRESRLAGAALDVFTEEPLPASSPLWDEPRILVSPHAGRSLEGPDYRWFGLFEENLRRYLCGMPLLNIVDYGKGY